MGLQGTTLGDAALITVTFLFTDIEGSTGLWEQESEAMRAALQRHNALLSAAIQQHHGYVFKTVGDAFCATYDAAADAIAAACQIQTALAAERWPTRKPLRVRIALHSGPAYFCAGDYFGTTVNRCSRLLAVTRGGQTLLSSATEALLCSDLPTGASLRDAGLLRLRDLPHPVHVFQLLPQGIPTELLAEATAGNGGKTDAVPLARLAPIDFYEVPTLPAIVVQALKILQDPGSDARAIERVIAHDLALSARILRVANSAFFGFSRRVGTIAEAVRVLGITNVQGIILSVGAFDAFRTQKLGLQDFWWHSIATATAARFLAPRIRCLPDEAFMAGLLHDIGKLIFAVQAEPAYQRVLELRRNSAMGSLEAERTLFEFTHPEVGEMVAERWNLPPQYAAAIAHHHQPQAATDRQFCALIGLADRAAYASARGGIAPDDGDAEWAELLDLLSFSTQQWDACLGHLVEARPTIDGFVGAIR